jgi:hypothetical protein
MLSIYIYELLNNISLFLDYKSRQNYRTYLKQINLSGWNYINNVGIEKIDNTNILINMEKQYFHIKMKEFYSYKLESFHDILEKYNKMLKSFIYCNNNPKIKNIIFTDIERAYNSTYLQLTEDQKNTLLSLKIQIQNNNHKSNIIELIHNERIQEYQNLLIQYETLCKKLI